jgi:hypothetical protein
MSNTIIDIPKEGDDSCTHKMIPETKYTLPNPDIRNPIRVKICKHCNREVHHGTPIGYGPIDPAYTE